MADKPSFCRDQLQRFCGPRPRLGSQPTLVGYMEEALFTKSPTHCSLWAALTLLTLGSIFGCYDGNELLKKAQSKALSTTLAEVDLGSFQTTLPRDPDTGHYMAVDLHIFGTVPRSRLSMVQRQLEDEEYRMRHETLAAVRQSTSEELSDPTFAKLRARLEQVVNKVLPDSPVREVGFYQFTMR
jgi:hypothetical protein